MDNKNFELYRKYLSFIQIRTLSLVIHLWHNLLININYYEYRLRSSTEIIVSILPLTTSVLFNCCEHFPDNILCSPSDAGIGKIPLFSFQFWHFVFHLDLLHYQCLEIEKSKFDPKNILVSKILFQLYRPKFNLTVAEPTASVSLAAAVTRNNKVWTNIFIDLLIVTQSTVSDVMDEPTINHLNSSIDSTHESLDFTTPLTEFQWILKGLSGCEAPKWLKKRPLAPLPLLEWFGLLPGQMKRTLP